MLSTMRRLLGDAVDGSITPHLIKEGKAYTEDGLLICNIFFKSKKMTEKEVRDYFTYFGEVISVNLLPDEDQTRGFVNFADASSAAKALETDNYTQTEHPFSVVADDSWNQPNGSEQCSPDNCYTSANPSCSAEHLNILPLPDYCLEDIYHNLKLSEQIHCARVCPRFHEVFQMYSKRAYRSFDCQVMDSMTRFEAIYFIRYVGVHIETLKIRFGHLPEIVEEFIGIFCVNVKRLTLEISGTPRYLCFRSFAALLKMPSLGIINLSRIPITDEIEIIKNMPQLVGLTLHRCTGLQISGLLDILKSLRRLKLLDIQFIFSYSDYLQVLNAITHYCTELVVLKMDYNGSISYARLAQLPNLKSLELRTDFKNTIDVRDCTQLSALLENLVFYKSKQLEHLTLPFTFNLATECIEAISKLKELKGLNLHYSDPVNDDTLRKFWHLKKMQKIALNSANITNKGVLELLYNCKNLCYVKMMGCRKIDNDIITEAIKILEERKYSLKKPVEFYVCGTSISKDALTDMPNYRAAVEGGLLQMNFHPTCGYIEEDVTNYFDEV